MDTVSVGVGAFWKGKTDLGPSIKDVCSQGGRGFVQCGHFADKEEGGSSDVDVRTFWCKNLEFFEIYGVSARTRGCWASADILRTRGRGVNFSRFCADVFYRRPLSISKYEHINVNSESTKHFITKWRIISSCKRLHSNGEYFAQKDGTLNT